MHELRLYRRSAGPSPPRRAKSLRRTSSIDVTWPEGQGQPGSFVGRGRDVLTGNAGEAPRVVAKGSFTARLTQDRRILELASDPPRRLEAILDQRAGGGLRKHLHEVIPADFAEATPLYLLLDDLSGASLVSGFTWSQWDANWVENLRRASSEPLLAAGFPDRTGICTGFAPGSSAFDPDTDRGGTRTGELRNPEDPEGWHDFPGHPPGPAFRRARRIDVWQDDAVRIEAAFQDSASTHDGDRAVVHEYILGVAADPATLRVTEIVAQPYVLPFVECPGAANNVQSMLGEPLARLRDAVLERLKGTAGCTHLNDALRALADVPALLARLRAEIAGA